MTAADRADREGELIRRSSDRWRSAVGLVVTGVMAAVVANRSISAWEASVFRHVNDVPSWVYPLVWPIMQLGTFGAVTVATLVALAFRRPRLALELVASGLIAYLAAKGLKELVDRGRPAEYLADVVIRGDPSSGRGWPSGHVSVATARAATLAPFVARSWRPLVWSVPVLVGFARMVVGAHWPLDVVGGFAVGWTAAAFLHLAGGVPAPAEPVARPVVG